MGLMQRETVAAGWMQPDEFADGMALGNALPGPIAPQVSAFVGYKLAGTAGAIVAVTGTVLPTTILMLVVIIYFFNYKDQPAVKAMIQGVRPFVIGLLAWTTYDVARTVLRTIWVGGRAAAKLGQGADRHRYFPRPQLDDDQPHLAGGGYRNHRADPLSKQIKILASQGKMKTALFKGVIS
jgi:hypothetical protein